MRPSIGATNKVVTQAPDEHKHTDDTGTTDKVAGLVLDCISELADKPNGDPSEADRKKKPVGVGLKHPPIPVPARPAPTPSLAGGTS